MRYYKLIDGNYITAIGMGLSGTEITQEEYDSLMTIIENKPPRTETTDFRLKTDLTWEEYEVEPPTDDIDDTEALEIILGGAE